MFKPAVVVLTLMLCACASKPQASSAQGTVSASSAPITDKDGKPVPQKNVALFPVQIEGKYGFIDKTGKLAIKADFGGASRFSEGLAAVQPRKGGKVGYIDETGKPVIPLEFDLADPFSEGYAAVMINQLWGYIDKTGKIVVTPKFVSAQRFSEGAALVGIRQGPSTTYAFINPKGDFIMDAAARFEGALPFGDGLSPVRSFGENFRYINHDGKTVIPAKYVTAGDFSGGLAPVEVQMQGGARWGYIDPEGKMIIGPTYLRAIPFTEGLSAVLTREKWGYINAKGAMVIPPKYDEVQQFFGGLAQVRTDKGWVYIDTAGKVIWEPK
jgi:hypothetical protein